MSIVTRVGSWRDVDPSLLWCLERPFAVFQVRLQVASAAKAASWAQYEGRPSPSFKSWASCFQATFGKSIQDLTSTRGLEKHGLLPPRPPPPPPFHTTFFWFSTTAVLRNHVVFVFFVWRVQRHVRNSTLHTHITKTKTNTNTHHTAHFRER